MLCFAVIFLNVVIALFFRVALYFYPVSIFFFFLQAVHFGVSPYGDFLV